MPFTTKTFLSKKFPVPVEVEAFMKTRNYEPYSSTSYVATMQFISGEWMLRVFGYKIERRGTRRFKEVYRERETKRETVVINSLWYNNFTHTNCVQWVKKSFGSYYGIWEVDDTWEVCMNPITIGYHCVCDYDAMARLDERLKYSAISVSKPTRPMDYIKEYFKHPEIEMLAKMGLSYLYTKASIFKMTKASRKAFIRWASENAAYIKAHQPNINYIRKCIKRGLTGDQMQEREVEEAIINTLEPFGITTLAQAKEIKKYLDKQHGGLQMYRDYIQMSKNARRKMSDRGVWFPKDFVKVHDELSAKAADKKSKVLNKKLQAVHQQLKKYEGEYNGFTITFPKAQSEFIKNGNDLHLCVGGMSYSKDMAEGRLVIAFVSKDGKPIETAEIDYPRENSRKKKPYLVQLRGDHNLDSPHHKDIEKTLQKFLTKFNVRPKLNQQGA